MLPSYRVIKDLLTVIPVLALFLLISVNPLAQSIKLPAPSTHVSDFAGVIDAQSKSRLDNLLPKLKEKSKIELYVAIVDTTGEQAIAQFSQQLARDWNIGVKTSRTKTLLLVVSVASKSSFTQFSRAAQLALPEGVLGEMSYRMQGPLGDGRFTEAVDSGVHVLVTALAEKFAFNVADLESSTVAIGSPEVTSESPQTVLASATKTQKTRPRTVGETPKAQPEATPPSEEPKPTETPVAEPVASESPKIEPTVTELPKPGESPKESPKTEAPNPRRKASATTRITPVRKKPAAESAEEDANESEHVELTLTLPLDRREAYLKEFLDTHPKSKSRERAVELLLMTYAGLADQKLKGGDTAGGIEQLSRVLNEAEVTASDELFSLIAQFPMNLYLLGEKEAAYKAAQNLETKFGSDPKRLLAVARFYMGIERATDAVRIADTAVRLAPDLAEAHRLLAMGHHISLRLDDAVAEYKKALELDPNSKASRASLADLYRASGKSQEALTLYNEQLLSDPKDRAARSGKVLALFELGRSEEANTALEATLADEPRNLALLAGTAYWLAAHDKNEKAYELARKAVDVESRYTWAQIALARSLVALKRPIEAERAIRTARKFGKFPTLTYELANVLASMGLYEEAVEVLRESFTIKEEKIHTYLAGHVPASEPGFLELLAPERRAGFYQATAADTADNAKNMKALLAFNAAITVPEAEKIDEAAAVAAAKDFSAGADGMRAFRQLYAASRLLRRGVAIDTAIELIAEAKKATDDALKVPVLTMAVQADEYRELRARSIAAGNVPDVGEAPPEVMANILKGRLEDLHGWALFNQEKYTDAITHLKQAGEILPAETPAWRTALWHLGVALEQSGEKEQALDSYIKSYRGGPVETVRRSEIERLYKSITGSLDGIEDRIAGTGAAAGSSSTQPSPSETPKTETAPVPDSSAPAPDSSAPAPASPTPAPEVSDEALRNAASRLRANIKITGRIVDSDNVGLGNVVVVLISPSGAVMASTTDNEGNYSFKVAPSQKTYRIIPSKEGYNFSPIDRAFAGLIDDQKDINFVGAKP
ncbi:MAG TPA: tetratricopeptide repeat protein [Pyrinomonadaceae bacterium]|nr:tetratricopeptide repeat protein [Pyrinomonadaceae bacterium]